MLTLLVGLLLFALAAVSDLLETQYVRAVSDGGAERAARLSVAMWLVSMAGLVAVMEVGLHVLPFEALGCYVGTRWAMK